MKLRDVLIRIVAFNVLPGLTVIATDNIAATISVGTYTFDGMPFFCLPFHQFFQPLGVERIFSRCRLRLLTVPRQIGRTGTWRELMLELWPAWTIFECLLPFIRPLALDGIKQLTGPLLK